MTIDWKKFKHEIKMKMNTEKRGRMAYMISLYNWLDIWFFEYCRENKIKANIDPWNIKGVEELFNFYCKSFNLQKLKEEDETEADVVLDLQNNCFLMYEEEENFCKLFEKHFNK